MDRPPQPTLPQVGQVQRAVPWGQGTLFMRSWKYLFPLGVWSGHKTAMSGVVWSQVVGVWSGHKTSIGALSGCKISIGGVVWSQDQYWGYGLVAR